VAVKHPSVEELACIAQAYHLSPTRQDLESFSALMTSTLLSYARLDQLTEPTLPVHSNSHFDFSRGSRLPIDTDFATVEISQAPRRQP